MEVHNPMSASHYPLKVGWMYDPSENPYKRPNFVSPFVWGERLREKLRLGQIPPEYVQWVQEEVTEHEEILQVGIS